MNSRPERPICAICKCVIWDHSPRFDDDDNEICHDCYLVEYGKRDLLDEPWQWADICYDRARGN